MDGFLVTKFHISLWGSLINQNIVILLYVKRSLQQCVGISFLQRKYYSNDFISYFFQLQNLTL